MTAPKIEMLCEVCRKKQKPDPNRSNDNFNVYNTGEKCECGGNFTLFIDGEPVSKKSDRGGESE